MAEIVNLRRSRKLKQRAEKERVAEANRALHGRPAAEKSKTRLAKTLDEKRLESHRRERQDKRGGSD
jgi:hypothetical protein